MNDRIKALVNRVAADDFQQQRDATVKQLRARHRPALDRAIAKHHATNPDQRPAKDAVRQAVRAGTLVRPNTCALSDSTCHGPIQAHHWHGYDRDHWLDVQWLCAMHHKHIN